MAVSLGCFGPAASTWVARVLSCCRRERLHALRERVDYLLDFEVGSSCSCLLAANHGPFQVLLVSPEEAESIHGSEGSSSRNGGATPLPVVDARRLEEIVRAGARASLATPLWWVIIFPFNVHFLFS